MLLLQVLGALATLAGLLLMMIGRRAVGTWRFRDLERHLSARWRSLAPAPKKEVLNALGIGFYAKDVDEFELDRLFRGVLASSWTALQRQGWLDIALLEEELALAFEPRLACKAERRSAGLGP